MSPRAAWRLDGLGFDVYDYVAGKTDWTARGLPTEGSSAGMPRAGSVLDKEVMTCSLDEPVAALRERFERSSDNFCIVTNDDKVVLGRVRKKHLGSADDELVGAIMEPGPSTVRYDEPLPDLVHRMQHHKLPSILVTDPAGRLLGVMRRSDAEDLLRRLQEEHEHHHHEH